MARNSLPLRAKRTRSLTAVLTAASLVLVGLVALPTPTAEAARATGGSARFPAVEWISWGSHLQGLVPDASGRITTTEEFTRGGDDYVVTCSISDLKRTRGSGNGALLIGYRPGAWQGDGFDNLYNIGGTDSSNQLVVGLRNHLDGNTVEFDFDCAATVERDGAVTALPLAGLVMANAESSITAAVGASTFREHVAASIDPAGTWRIIDRLRGTSCTEALYASRTTSGGLSRLVLNGANNTNCEGSNAAMRPNPMAIAYMEPRRGSQATVSWCGYHRAVRVVPRSAPMA